MDLADLVCGGCAIVATTAALAALRELRRLRRSLDACRSYWTYAYERAMKGGGLN